MQLPPEDIPEPPEGVTLRDPEDTDSIRGDIENSMLEAMNRYVNGYSYGGVKLELKDLRYVGPDRFSKREQHEALLNDKMLARRLRGTVRLVNEEDNSVLDERKNLTLARVPYLTERGTFVSNGSEFSPVMQSRLLPGAYARRRENGELECFHSDTEVWTEAGLIPIGKIVRERLEVRVWSYDFERGEFVLKPVVGWYKNPVRTGMGRLRYDGAGRWPSVKGQNRDTVWVTPQHQMMEMSGTKRRADDSTRPILVVEDALSPWQEQIMLGSLLGDGYVNASGCYQEAHSEAQAGYLGWKAAALGDLVKNGVTVGETGDKSFSPGTPTARIHSKSARCLVELREAFYGEDGKKRVSRAVLDRVDERGLAVWFGDDGCSFLASTSTHEQVNCYVVILSTDGFEKPCVDLIVGWLRDRWGIIANAGSYTDKRSANPDLVKYPIHVCGPHAERLLSLVTPYLHSDLHYKLPPRPPTGQCADCGEEQDRRRKICNSCWLQRFRANPAMDTRGLRKRFGGMSVIRALIASGKTPPELNPGARWDEMKSTLGSRNAEALSDAALRKVLREAPYTFETGMGAVRERTTVAYDIQVEDTHNYVANGVLVSNCHLNTRPGTGSAMRVTFDPTSTQYRLKVGSSDLHAYSVFHDLGVSDEELERRWGPDILAANKAKYSRHTLDRLYKKAIPKWERDESQTPADKVAAIRAALDRAQVAESILKQNLPNLFSQEKSAHWRMAGRAIEVAQQMVKQSAERFDPDFTPEQVFTIWSTFEAPLEKRASFSPDLSPEELRETYNSICGQSGPQLASMRKWPDHWLDDQDNQGWLQWYENYAAGRRSETDEKQKARWKNFKRLHGTQFVAKPTPRRAYALVNWGIDPIKLLPEDKADDMRKEMERYRAGEYVKWYMNRHDFDDAQAEKLGELAKKRGARVVDEIPTTGELMSLALDGYILPEDLR